MSSLRYKVLIFISFSGSLLTGCASSGGVFAPSDAELEAESSRQFAMMRAETPLVTDRATIDYVLCVVTAVVDALEPPYNEQNWDLAIFDTQMVNAFAMPGGNIGVHGGILDVATNQDQLATVIGHEIAHVNKRHVSQRASRSGFTDAGVYVAAIVLGQGHGGLTNTAYQSLSYGASLGLLLPYNRGQESEADIIGIEYMAKAGFDPRESAELWKKMSEEHEGKAPPEFLSTHPADAKRIDALVSMYPKTLVLYNEAKAQGRNPGCTRK
jgi:predicted Zn-dependent protease